MTSARSMACWNDVAHVVAIADDLLVAHANAESFSSEVRKRELVSRR